MKPLSKTSSIRQAFADTLVKLAKTNRHIYIVDVDLQPSFFLDKFAQKYPSRFIQCGVSEANAAGIAAGLAKSGKTVFLTSYASFSPAINWNTIRQSICLNHVNVKIVGSHAGLMSTDLGSSHQMLEDLALMRSLPDMEVFSPIDAIETEKIVTTLCLTHHPAYLRLVRPSTPLIYSKKLSFTIGKSHVLKTGKDITILGHGPILLNAFSIHSKLSLEIINCSSVKPLDSTTILKSITKTGRAIVIEDHQKNGGLGEAIASLLLTSGIKCRFVHLGVDNRFGQSGKDYQKLYDYYGIGATALTNTIKKLCKH